MTNTLTRTSCNSDINETFNTFISIKKNKKNFYSDISKYGINIECLNEKY